MNVQRVETMEAKGPILELAGFLEEASTSRREIQEVAAIHQA